MYIIIKTYKSHIYKSDQKEDFTIKAFVGSGQAELPINYASYTIMHYRETGAGWHLGQVGTHLVL